MPGKDNLRSLQKTVSADKWKKIGAQRRAGVVVPLFSVYSRNSLGVGDLADLKLLIDWCVKAGNSILQLLPMNELGSVLCPYDSVCSFALEPVYLSLESIPGSERAPIKDMINRIKNVFPAGKPNVDYRIRDEKLKIAWETFQLGLDDNSPELNKYREDNSYWLEDFALFKVLKSCQGGRAWYEWEEKYRDRQAQALEAFRKEHEKEILFQVWLQWNLFKQFGSVKQYAHKKKILIKGDLPILISRDSSDVWAHREFFKLEFAAGAPPDMYCSKGQRWGMPTYKWEVIAADGYRYLKEKLKYAQNFYNILRIDHVVGIFRIWGIPYNDPLENQGLNGIFDPKDEKEWEKHGRDILTVMVKSTSMLLCAEDLGVIPKACPKVLRELGILGNDVQRWTKDWVKKHDFSKPSEYRFLSVVMLSTHDTTNWPAWWENEAGTFDEGLFMRRCAERGIDFNCVKPKLFDPDRSRHGRLRWLEAVDSAEKYISILNKKPEELKDFIEFYENTYREKEKLWMHFKIKGPMREKCDAQIIRCALKITLDSGALFSIQLITDWLYLADLIKGDPYDFRMNTPGTTSANNWSLTIPLSLEELLKHDVCQDIRRMISSAERI
ncbi:MAG: 4-alpha-glucanotransferase [Candidatus Omnitrophota bacterium]